MSVVKKSSSDFACARVVRRNITSEYMLSVAFEICTNKNKIYEFSSKSVLEQF